MKATATFIATALVLSTAMPAWAQAKPAPPAQAQPSTQKPATGAAASALVAPPADYVIGAGDVLFVNYWRDKDMTGDYIVRPDGKITLPLLNDVDAIGLTPDQLKERLLKASASLFVDPSITVGVKTINSRKVFISGGVDKPGPYDLLTPMTVAQLISVAGGLREFVNGKDIRILRNEGGKQTVLKFNYKELLEGKNLNQNIPLKPGDTVLVPE